MAFFIGIVAVLQIAAGVLTFIAAKSAIHEILGSVSFGMGVLAFALTVIIVKLDDIKKASEENATIAFGAREAQMKIAAAFERIAKP